MGAVSTTNTPVSVSENFGSSSRGAKRTPTEGYNEFEAVSTRLRSPEAISAAVPTARGRTRIPNRRGKPNGLYPELEPYRHGLLRVSRKHEIYFEECGNPDGKPALFVHGGPGAGADVRARRFFDPQRYRIILFDQRGCGRSRPHASLEDNTTWHLVRDIETLREFLSVERWLLFGGSWGATLALAYAQTHPVAVSELILRGIFLARPSELRWFYQEGASAIFPDAWEQYVALIPTGERHDLLRAFYRRLTSGDAEIALKAAKAWSVWEASTSYLTPDEKEIEEAAEDKFALAVARIECHYFVNHAFLKDSDQLLSGARKIAHIPSIIVQGRYDIVSPAMSAWELHRAWPEADFRLVPNAGHSAYEAGILHELVGATNTFSSR